MKTLRRFLSLLRPHLGAMVLAGLAMAGVALCTVQLAALIRPLFDRFLASGGTAGSRWHLPTLLVAVYLGKGFCAYTTTTLLGRVGQVVVGELRCRLHDAALAWPLGRHTRVRGGDLLSRALVDVDRLETAISEKVGSVAREALVLVALGTWLLWLDPALALGSMLAAPLVVLPLTGFGRRVRRESRVAQAELGAMAAIFQETVNGIRVVKAFGMEGFEARRLREACGRLLAANLRALRVSAATPPLMELVGGLAAAGVFLYGSQHIAQGRMTIGGFTSFLTTLLLMYTPVKKISNANNFLQASLAAAERVFEVLDEPPESAIPLARAPLSAPRHGIRFERVWFRYGEEWVLRGVDLRLGAGEVVALVGASGAGKSTVANLLLRFYDPQRGRILWDDLDLRSADHRRVREQIALVTQETILFHDTVARNIAYGREGLPEEVVRRAAAAAGAEGFIRLLPAGYDTLLGERGERLSLGQRQRIAIARALVKEAPVLVLDEATSSLDVETEREVQDALEGLMRHRTVLLIAHRLSTVRRADRIVVLEGGRIVETGDHRALLARGGAYSRLHREHAAAVGGAE